MAAHYLFMLLNGRTYEAGRIPVHDISAQDEAAIHR
jgi:hypothetical protein